VDLLTSKAVTVTAKIEGPDPGFDVREVRGGRHGVAKVQTRRPCGGQLLSGVGWLASPMTMDGISGIGGLWMGWPVSLRVLPAHGLGHYGGTIFDHAEALRLLARTTAWERRESIRRCEAR